MQYTAWYCTEVNVGFRQHKNNGLFFSKKKSWLYFFAHFSQLNYYFSWTNDMSSPSYQQKLPAEVFPSSADPGAVETSFVQHLATPGNSESDSAGSGQRLVDEDTNPNDGVPRHGNPPTILAFDHLAPSLREAIVCSAFFVLTLAAFATSYVLVEPHQRPMPIQRLQASNETVRRLSNNETYKGETIDTLALLVLCGVCPFIIQW